MGKASDRVAAWACPAVLAGVGAAMVWQSWGQWPDVLVDFGRELYVPWQLSEGKVLYRDVAWFNGPLSPYLNALWFRLFGVGLRTLALCNVALLAGVVALAYRLLASIGDRFAATVGCLVLLAVFAFSQITLLANYNWVCPYSHEITHGVALALLGLFFLSVYGERRAWWAVAASGLALGLTFLTKAEVFLAAALGMGVGLGVMLWAERPGWRRLVRLAALFAGGALLPPLLAFAMLATAMPAGQALRGTAGTWPYVLGSSIGSQPFYKGHMGALAPWRNARLMLTGAGSYAVLVGGGSVLAVALGRRKLSAPWAVLGVAAVATAWATGWSWQWPDAGRPLPVLLVAAGVWQVGALRRDRAGRRGRALRLGLIVFALALLAKIVLNVRTYHYGFALAMPGALVVAAAGLSWVPSWLAARGARGVVVRVVVVIALAAVAAGHVRASRGRFATKTATVGRGADAFRSGSRGDDANDALAEIERRMGPGQTLAVLPEGAMLNYLARRTNPTPFVNFMPPEVIMFGEDSMLDAFRADPPDWIAIVEKNTLEYGVGYFGQGYARGLFAWVRANYKPVFLAGQPPLHDGSFGIQLLERVAREHE